MLWGCLGAICTVRKQDAFTSVESVLTHRCRVSICVVCSTVIEQADFRLFGKCIWTLSVLANNKVYQSVHARGMVRVSI